MNISPRQKMIAFANKYYYLDPILTAEIDQCIQDNNYSAFCHILKEFARSTNDVFICDSLILAILLDDSLF